MSPADDTACVYSAEVMHERFTTAQYRFRYRIFSVLLDIDGIEQAAASTRLFSLNRFNLLSFHDRRSSAARGDGPARLGRAGACRGWHRRQPAEDPPVVFSAPARLGVQSAQPLVLRDTGGSACGGHCGGAQHLR